MWRKIFGWMSEKKEEVTPKLSVKGGGTIFSTHANDNELTAPRTTIEEINAQLSAKLPKVKAIRKGVEKDYGMAMDSDEWNAIALKEPFAQSNMSEALFMWYATQTFIGWQISAIVSQHWLVNKACTMPCRDAVRKGFDMVSTNGEDLPKELVATVREYDRKYRLKANLIEFLRFGRVFGIRIALFKVDSKDKKYYEKPFNIDGITPGSYKGIVQVDPYWTAPQLDIDAASTPDSVHFYEPTYWIINGKSYHRSHLIIYRHDEPADILKPQYLYGGVPLPQQIMERVYAAERTANEAPQLAMTKRTTIWKTDMEAFAIGGAKSIEKLQRWAAYRDNYGIKLGDKNNDEFEQYDTALAELDEVIMTQYQIVCAISGTPSTKMLGTSPKGFNATGEFEESDYHESLESIQANDLSALIERHWMLTIKSFSKEKNIDVTVSWSSLDSMTAKEQADVNLIKAQTGQILVDSGAITSEDEHNRIAADLDSGYDDLGAYVEPEDDPRLDEENPLNDQTS